MHFDAAENDLCHFISLHFQFLTKRTISEVKISFTGFSRKTSLLSLPPCNLLPNPVQLSDGGNIFFSKNAKNKPNSAGKQSGALIEKFPNGVSRRTGASF